jgi:hypothetical protein
VLVEHDCIAAVVVLAEHGCTTAGGCPRTVAEGGAAVPQWGVDHAVLRGSTARTASGGS